MFLKHPSRYIIIWNLMALMAQCALMGSNFCKQCSLCAISNKGTLVIHCNNNKGEKCTFCSKRIPVVDTTIKLCLSVNPTINMSTTNLLVCKQQHPPTANYNVFSIFLSIPQTPKHIICKTSQTPRPRWPNAYSCAMTYQNVCKHFVVYM